MIKKILVILDKSKSSQRVRDISIKIAEDTSSKITAIGILDTSFIKIQHSAEPLSGIAFDLNQKIDLISRSHAHILHLMENFVKRVNNKKLIIDSLEVKGNPIEEIEYLSCENNIIIMSKKTNFQFDLGEETDQAVKQIARDNLRPIIMVPPYEEKGSDILIAYDGSAASARSLHMFLLLGFWKNHQIHIISINSIFEKATSICEQAFKMCNAYNINPIKHIVASNKNPADIVLAKAEEIKAWMIVIGAFKHTQIHDVLFPSSTSILMNKSEIPLFIHK